MLVRQEIQKYARKQDVPVLLWLLSKYNMSSKWSFVAKCTFKSTGTQSYQCVRVWEPTEEGTILYNHFNPCNTCHGKREIETGIGTMVCTDC